MKTHCDTLSVRTEARQQMINVTAEFAAHIARSQIRNGFAGLFSQHTTAMLLVNEWQAALLDDMADFLRRAVPDDLPYKHNSPLFSDCDRSNAASHLRSILFNNSVVLPVIDGQPVLGRFQSVILAELDGPRDRTLKLQIMGE